MHIESLTPSMMPSLINLAREVEPLFEARLADDRGFQEFIAKKILQHEALVVCEESNLSSLMGLIAFSHNNNAISWFAVFEQYRGRGIGTELLSQALNELDSKREVSVITFRENNKAGNPARRLYQKFGFKDFDVNFFHDEHPRCLMIRPLQT